MTQTALIISHGQPSDPRAGADEIRALAHQVMAYTPGMNVHGVTLAEPGALEDLAAQVAADTLIYPMFMADGWFTTEQLPKRLNNARPASDPLTILPPFGCDPALPAFAVDWLRDELARMGWQAAQSTLIVLGHGSGRSPRPAAVTRVFAQEVQTRLPFAELRVGFVEEAPFLAETLGAAPPQSLTLPFFAAQRGHVLDDIPQAQAETGFAGTSLPPIGTHTDIAAFIAKRLIDATRKKGSASPSDSEI